MGRIKELHILMGLPGSGKSTFARYEHDKDHQNIYVVDVDKYTHCQFTQNYDIQSIIDTAMCDFTIQNIVIVDGPFTTNHDIKTVLKTFIPYYRNIEIYIHRWDENRKICAKNDGCNDKSDSYYEIMSTVLEEVNESEIEEYVHSTNNHLKEVVKHKVQLKPVWYRYFKQSINIYGDGKLRSKTWPCIGLIDNLYDGIVYCSMEYQNEFSELYDLLENKYPHIKLSDFRRILKECVSIETGTETCCYNEKRNMQNWACDLEKMYNILNECNYTNF